MLRTAGIASLGIPAQSKHHLLNAKAIISILASLASSSRLKSNIHVSQERCIPVTGEAGSVFHHFGFTSFGNLGCL